MLIKREKLEDVYNFVPQDPCDMVRAKLPKPQFPVMEAYIPRLTTSLLRGHYNRMVMSSPSELSL
jgi:hypothetical protein